MNRGGWIMLIGGVVLLIGIGLFAFGSASFLATLDPTFTVLSPGGYQNRTVEVAEVGTIVTFVIGIQDFSAGDEVTILLRLPSGQDVQQTRLDNAGPVTVNHIAEETGAHTAVIQNTAALSVEVFHTATGVGLTAQGLLFAGTLTGIGGFITLIGGLIRWIIDRGRQPRQSLVMPPPPSRPP